jgi:hypothetical protein
VNAGVIRIRLEQRVHIFHQPCCRELLRVIAQLVVVIHLDGIKRAELGAVAAVHTDGGINKKVLGLRHWTLGHRVFGALNPNALRRAHFGANAATGAFNLVLFRIVYQKRDVAKVLRQVQPLFGVLHRRQAVVFGVLPSQWAGLRGQTTLVHRVLQVFGIRCDKVLQRHAQTFEDATAK